MCVCIHRNTFQENRFQRHSYCFGRWYISSTFWLFQNGRWQMDDFIQCVIHWVLSMLFVVAVLVIRSNQRTGWLASFFFVYFTHLLRNNIDAHKRSILVRWHEKCIRVYRCVCVCVLQTVHNLQTAVNYYNKSNLTKIIYIYICIKRSNTMHAQNFEIKNFIRLLSYYSRFLRNSLYVYVYVCERVLVVYCVGFIVIANGRIVGNTYVMYASFFM